MSFDSNGKLNDDLGRPVTEDAVFVLVASKSEEVRDKVSRMPELTSF